MLANWSEILEKIFSYTLIHDGFVATVPIFYACMCAVISRQANIVNIAAEGIIMFGAFFGFAASYFTGSYPEAIGITKIIISTGGILRARSYPGRSRTLTKLL